MPPQYPEMETESGPVVAEDGDPQASGGDLVADGTPQVKTEEPGQAGSCKREPEEDETTSAGASTSKDPAKSADFNPFKGKYKCCLLIWSRLRVMNEKYSVHDSLNCRNTSA